MCPNHHGPALLVWSLGRKAVVLAQSAYLHLHLGYNLLAIADHHICLLQVTGSCN